MSKEPHWAGDYVGIPFVAKGRSEKGLDCWGLVQKVQMEQFGIFLPSLDGKYSELTVEGNSRVIASAVRELPVEKTENPLEGDIAILSLGGYPAHVGVYCVIEGTPMILHADPLGRCDSRLSRVSDPSIAARIEGYYHVI